MTYRELLEHLARQIGHHQIPLNPAATELRGLVDSGAVHYELITQVATALYTGNRCRRLMDAVRCDASFEALEPIRMAVLRSPKTDVDAWRLMDNLCSEIAVAFQSTPTKLSPASGTVGAPTRKLYAFRRRLRLP